MTISWDPISQPVDHALVAGVRTPGLCEVVNAGSPRQWDERRGYALSGSTLVFRGIRLADFSLRLRLYSPEDWRAWHEFAPVVARPPQGERSTALDIVHPILEEVGIRSAVVLDVVAPAQTADGEWTVEVRMKEFRRPVVTVAPVDGSSARVESNASRDRDIQIERASGALAAELRAGGIL